MDVKQRIIALFEVHIGRETARLYAEFYKDKDESIVIQSAHELLGEVIGAEKTKQLLQPIVPEGTAHETTT